MSKLPPFTKIILISNLVIFLVLNLYIGVNYGAGFVQELVLEFGLKPSSFWAGKFWQPITSMFLHGSLLHIAANMLAFVSIGVFLERAIGTLRFGILYFVSGLVGSLAILIFQGNTTIATIGASGAVSGLIGALAVLYPRTQVLLLFVFPMQVRTLALAAFGLSIVFQITDFFPGLSHLGHAGGILGGFLYTLLAVDRSTIPSLQTGQGRPQKRQPGNGHRSIMEQLMTEIKRRHQQDSKSHSQHSQFDDQSDQSTDSSNQTGDYYQTSDGRVEREINPENKHSHTPTKTNSPTFQNRKVYYDPLTGRYYSQEKHS